MVEAEIEDMADILTEHLRPPVYKPDFDELEIWLTLGVTTTILEDAVINFVSKKKLPYYGALHFATKDLFKSSPKIEQGMIERATKQWNYYIRRKDEFDAEGKQPQYKPYDGGLLELTDNYNKIPYKWLREEVGKEYERVNGDNPFKGGR